MEFEVNRGTHDGKKEIELRPEYVHGYCGSKNNIQKFANKKVMYPVHNLIVVYDLFDRVQSIFSEHVNKVILLKCRENTRSVLSAEETKSNIKIYLWDKQNFKTLAMIKIKKINFLDIDYLNDVQILVLCKYADKLILFVFFVERYNEKGVSLKGQKAYVIKSVRDFYQAKGENTRKKENEAGKCNAENEGGKCNAENEGGKCNAEKNGHGLAILEKRIMVKWPKWGDSTTGLFRKKRATNRTHRMFDIKTKSNIPEKIYFRKINAANTENFVKVEELKKGTLLCYHIVFIRPFGKMKKRFNELLKNFKIFVEINYNVCIYNQEYVFVHVLRNNILYERLRNNRITSSKFLNDGTFSWVKEGLPFFSFLSIDIFVNGLLLHYLAREEKIRSNISLVEVSSWGKAKVDAITDWSKNLCETNLNHDEVQNDVQRCIIRQLKDFFNDEISVIEVVNCFCSEERNDIDTFLNMYERVQEKRKKKGHHKITKSNGQKGNHNFMITKRNNRKNRYLRKKTYFFVGSKRGIIIIIDLLRPHKVIHLEKICTYSIVSIFSFQSSILILSSSGILYFLKVPNFVLHKAVDILNLGRRGPVSTKAGGTSLSSVLLKNDSLYAFRQNSESKNSFFVKNKVSMSEWENKVRSDTTMACFCNDQMRRLFPGSISSYVDKNKNCSDVEKNKNCSDVEKNKNCAHVEKNKNCSDVEKRHVTVCASCLLDIYTLVLGTSNDDMIFYNLFSNEICYIYTGRHKINCFLLERNHIIYTVQNCIYKLSIINYNIPVKILTLGKIRISSFLFYSSDVLICGTLKGCLYFFSISNESAKVINKVERKDFMHIGLKRLDGMGSYQERENKQKGIVGKYEHNNEVICLLYKKVYNNNASIRKWYNLREDEPSNQEDKIVCLILNKSKNILLCACEKCLFLFRIQVGGNEKIHLKYLRSLHFANIIVDVNLIKNYDNLFYVSTRDVITKKSGVNNFYNIYHLCSFNCTKNRRYKMNTIYKKVLLENIWHYPFLYNHEEQLDLLKNKFVCLLNRSVFVVYSYSYPVRKSCTWFCTSICSSICTSICTRPYTCSSKRDLRNYRKGDKKKIQSGKAINLGNLKSEEKNEASEEVSRLSCRNDYTYVDNFVKSGKAKLECNKYVSSTYLSEQNESIMTKEGRKKKKKKKKKKDELKEVAKVEVSCKLAHKIKESNTKSPMLIESNTKSPMLIESNTKSPMLIESNTKSPILIESNTESHTMDAFNRKKSWNIHQHSKVLKSKDKKKVKKEYPQMLNEDKDSMQEKQTDIMEGKKKDYKKYKLLSTILQKRANREFGRNYFCHE
ncbi:hypothetical protein, conserved [Plasmodium gonderi]|uniref:Uncharacterized protein n=1 Tax=Plasmodium gonderi TaxID=77519 RepID=A0A1Y1JDP9_PLAGO|nr:hypothetical protein, conserved [Plasmodium gonderi]GAW79445.1 hypothetical protein, conserved [Plasmodium gonderi]